MRIQILSRIVSKQKIWIGVALGLLYGCSAQHIVRLDPQVFVASSQIGANKDINLRIIDKRPDNLLSRWEGKANIRKYTVIPDRNLSDILEEKFKEGLHNMEFRVRADDAQTPLNLQIEILRLRSQYQNKLATMNVRVQSSLRVSCRNGISSFAHTFEDQKVLSKAPVSLFPNEKLINASLSDLIRKILSDPTLLHCLSK
ncbi:MAG: hypothetical protein G3M78_09395 [Candidatus Nitrohelix vancouverensis]|uniref:Lipoprotein n=1 Tax=Candidatus Nitrohelix vancouverensis TaxID=2705534 RepID=A0A7T0G3P3_9BACT|nr:MAG: hypothetical protein G3M78_09395 [Candidatus Nitrohelix vancouverensis]